MRSQAKRSGKTRCRGLHPDLAEATLEERIVPTSSSIPPMILTTGGYAVIATPLVFNGSLGTAGGLPGTVGPIGGNGGAIPTSFVIFGFGMTVFSAGNSLGFAGAGGGGAVGSSVSLNIITGSGANEAGSIPTSSRTTAGQGPLPSATNFLYIGAQVPSVSATITPQESPSRPRPITPLTAPMPAPPPMSLPALPRTISPAPPGMPVLPSAAPMPPGTVPAPGPR